MAPGKTTESSHHEIGESDILCSKDKSLSSHPGNRLFRSIIEDAKATYRNAADKATKMKITKSILDRLHNDHGCRFVKFDSELAEWVELTPSESRDKVGHALRFAIRCCKNRESSPELLDSTSNRSQPVKKTKTLKRSPRVISPPCPPKGPNSISTSVMPTTTVSLATKRIEAFQARLQPHACLSISMEKIKTARQNLDRIIQRQNELLSTMISEMDEVTDSRALNVPTDNLPAYARSSFSTHFDLDFSSKIFTSLEFDFLLDDMEAV